MPRKASKPASPSPIPDFLRLSVQSGRDAAAFFGVAPATIETWLRRGMPREEVQQGRYRYVLSDIAQWIAREWIATRQGAKNTRDDSGAPSVKDEIEAENLQLLRIKRMREEGRLVDAEWLIECAHRIGAVLADAGERIEKEHGSKVLEFFNEAVVDELQREIEQIHRHCDDSRGKGITDSGPIRPKTTSTAGNRGRKKASRKNKG